MRAEFALFVGSAFLLVSSWSHSATAPQEVRDFVIAGRPLETAPADPAIAGALQQVSPEALRRTVEALVAFGNRNTLSSMDRDLPPGRGVTAAAQWIQAQFEAIGAACGGCLEVKTDTFTEPPQSGPKARITQPTLITNVYAILRGTDPGQAKRMYLVTGHYDSRQSDTMNTHGEAPGANDDSSGVAVSLESARVLSRLRFPGTLVFAAVAGEEQGLNGSAHLAKLAKDEGWDLAGVLNDDIVGGDTTPGDALQDKSRVRVFSEGVAYTATPDEVRRLLYLGLDGDSPSRELARAVVDAGATYLGAQPVPFRPVLEMRLDRYLRGGDHYSFNKEGFAAVRFTEWRENFAHQHQDVRVEEGVQYGDLIRYDDFAYIAKVTRLNAAALATLASAPGAPRDVHIDTHDLDNNSLLEWRASPGATPSIRYEVLWRETAAANWQYAAAADRYPVGSATAGGAAAAGVAVAPLPANETAEAPRLRARLPVSKDNVIFGIRACDAAGHCSPAVTPLPSPAGR